MDLLEKIQEGLTSEDTWWCWNGSVKTLEDEIISEHRWYDRRRQVIEGDGQLVAVEFNVGSTEMQEDTELEGEAYVVRPVEVTVVRYERV